MHEEINVPRGDSQIYPELLVRIMSMVRGYCFEVIYVASNIKAILTQQPPVRSRRMLIVDLDFERKGYVQMGFDGETYKS